MSGGPAKRRSSLHDVAAILGMTLVIQAIGLFTGAATARLLGPSGRGLLAAITVWPSAIANLGDLGGPLAYQYRAASAPQDRPALVRNLVRIIPLQAAILIAVAIPVMALALRDYPGALETAVVFVLLFMPLNLAGRYAVAIHQGSQNFKAFNRVRLALALSYAVGIAALLLMGVDSVGPVVAVTIVSNVICVAIASAGLPLAQARESRFDGPLVKRIFSFGAKAHIGHLTPIDTLQIDVAIVVVMLGAEQAGLYVVAVSAANVIRSQGTGIGLVALSSVAAIEGPGQSRAIGAFFRSAGLLIVATAALIIAAAGVLVPLIYGHAFDGAVTIVQILAVGMVAAALRQVLGDCLRGAGRPTIGSVAEVVSWLVAVPALIVLVPAYDADGAAIAVSVSYFAALAVLVAATGRSGVSPGDLLIPRVSDLRQLRAALARKFRVRGST